MDIPENACWLTYVSSTHFMTPRSDEYFDYYNLAYFTITTDCGLIPNYGSRLKILVELSLDNHSNYTRN